MAAINILGLVLNLVGTSLLWWFSVSLPGGPAPYDGPGVREGVAEASNRLMKGQRAGLACLGVGFVLQLVAAIAGA